MVGANPLVSHGSVLSAPRVREQLERGRRPRRARRRRRPAPHRDRARSTSTSPIRPDADAWLLLSMLHVIFEEGLADAPRIWPADARGAEELARARARASRPSAPRRRDRRARRARARARARRSRRRRAPPPTGAPARAWAASARSSRTCSTRSTPSPATSTGPAARCSAAPPIALDDIGEQAGLATYGKIRSRIGGYPDVIGNLPATLLPEGDHDAGRGPDPRVLRVGRQPGAVGARRRRARARAGASST